MSLRSDSYGTVEDVRALTRHLLDGAESFDAFTRPTLDDVEGMIDRWSATLNVALLNRGITVPVSNAIAKQMCEQWVIRKAAAEVELTQRGTGWNDDEGSRIRALRPDDMGDDLALRIAEALRQQGELTPGRAHAGLTFTGDPTPIFTRGQFDL